MLFYDFPPFYFPFSAGNNFTVKLLFAFNLQICKIRLYLMLQFERFYDISYSANSCNATNKYIVNSCIDTCTKDTIYK